MKTLRGTQDVGIAVGGAVQRLLRLGQLAASSGAREYKSIPDRSRRLCG